MRTPRQKTPINTQNSPEVVLAAAVEALKTLQSSACGLDEYLDQLEEPLLRKRLTNVLFILFRRRRTLEETLKNCCTKPPAAEVKNLLMAALVMAKFQNSLAPESVVNIAVTLARKEFGNFVARFVNAVLRKALKLVESIKVDPLPPRISDRWKKAFSGDEYDFLADLFTMQPANTVRLRSGCEISEDLALTPLDPGLPWQFFECGNFSELLAGEDFAQGKFYIQDPAPAHVVTLLAKYGNLLAEKVNFLDLCAAPGGKFIMTMELLSSLQKKLLSATAFDRSVRRLELVKKNMLRCKVTGKVESGDAADPGIFAGESFELVTCDVPCSNSGVFRHRPDALWRWSVKSMQEIAALQYKILKNAARLTAPGGLLLYSTCSLEAEENSLQITKFLEEHNEFELLEEKLVMPQVHCDGTYAALLKKTPEKI